MTVAFQGMFGILERWNNNQVTPSLSKPHELSYISNILWKYKLLKIHFSGVLYQTEIADSTLVKIHIRFVHLKL